MKKFATLALALVLSLLLVLPALAEETAPAAEEGTTMQAVQMDWNQTVIDAFAASGLKGEMGTVTLSEGLAFQMLIPEGFAQRELTEEEKTLGISLALSNEAAGSEIRIMDSPIDWANDVSGIAQKLLAANPETAIQFAVVNGTTALISGMKEDDSVNATFDLGNSHFVQIEFRPLEGNNLLAQYLIASVQF